MKIVPDRLRPIQYCKNYLKKVSNRQVLSGPFRGLKYIDQSAGSEYFPKLLGSYEKELHTIIEGIDGETVIIGAGEGYYPVGLAKKLGKKMICYEESGLGRSLIGQLSKLNGVDALVSIRGKCNPVDLQNKDLGMEYGIMDIEGSEMDFLYHGFFEKQKHTKWVIELHSNETHEKFRDRLDNIFKVEFVPTEPRGMRDFPVKVPWYARSIFQRYWVSLLQEWRSDSIGWLVLTPKL